MTVKRSFSATRHAGVYKRIILKEDRVIGAVMYGETSDSSLFFSLLKSEENIGPIRDTLIFGPAFQGGGQFDPFAAVAALPDDAEICGCNGICKGTIVNAISTGAHDLSAIKSETKASASCGSCSGLVEQILASTLGDEFKVPEAQPICGCTEFTHDDLRRIIKSQGLKTNSSRHAGMRLEDILRMCVLSARSQFLYDCRMAA